MKKVQNYPNLVTLARLALKKVERPKKRRASYERGYDLESKRQRC
jgi:hypothetical protein